jgi:acetyl-CoA acetyltransferase
MSGTSISRKVVVAGVGYSPIARRTGRSEGSLAVEACMNAIGDAGFTTQDIDGLAVWPDRISTAFEGPSIAYMYRALGLSNVRYYQAFGVGPGQMSSIVGATYAIASGAARVVVCFRAHLRQEQRYYVPGTLSDDANVAAGDLAFRAPYGVPAGAPRSALWAQRHAYEFGTTDEHRGAVVLTCREHAQLNPRAVWYGTPLTMSEYLESDLISSPLRILDCDMPVDGAVGVVLTSAEYERDLPRRPVYIDALAHGTGPSLSFDTWPDVTFMAGREIASELWSRSSVTPDDVDVCQLYDGFSTLALCWLEDLGFVGKGEAGDWFLEGRGKLRGGDLPVNTDGGQLGVGRLHGFGKLAETVHQLRGECGERQVANAQVGLTSAGAGPLGTAILLTI